MRPRSQPALTLLLVLALLAMLLVSGAAAHLDAASMPSDLVKLEKLVSLELAHVRDIGPTEPAKRKILFDAHQLDRQAEDSIKAGDYKSAEQNLLRARVLLRQLNDQQ